MRKLISILIPAYNEQENLPFVFERVTALFAGPLGGYELEAIILDNASNDRTEDVAREICQKDPHWKYVRYSRNFGADVSMTAGLDFAKGDAVVNLFSDLQDPPEKITAMVEEWEKGAEVVNGVVQERNDSSWLKTLGARMAYKIISSLSECDIQPGATDFRLLDRRVVEVLKGMREHDRYMKGLVGWVGFKRAIVPYDRAPRERGNSNANIFQCVIYALNAMICFSGKPLQFATFFGFTVTLGSVLLGLLYLVLYFFRPDSMGVVPPGITTILLLVVFSLGLQTLFLGLIGEYLARVYNQGKGRPLYIVDRGVGIQVP